MITLIDQLSLGFDSALCCLALGTAVPARGTHLVLAMLFGLSDLAASLLACLPVSHFVPMPPAALYLAFAMLLGIGARSYPRLAWVAPFLLSLDNLYATSSVPDAFADGAISSLFALAALRAGAWLSQRETLNWMHAQRRARKKTRCHPQVTDCSSPDPEAARILLRQTEARTTTRISMR